jgi:hypothetical protein
MARCGQSTNDRYDFGNDYRMELANELIRNRYQVDPVGLLPRNATADGAMDIERNIQEWLNDLSPMCYPAEPSQASSLRELAENSSFRYRYQRRGSRYDVA